MKADFFRTRRTLVMGALGSLALAGCGERNFAPGGSSRTARFAGETMGTTYSVRIARAGLSAARLASLRDAVHGALSGVDRRMSLYRDDSEVAAFNRAAAREPVAISAELFGVLDAAREISDWSAGAFDITVAPLVQAWGFGTEKRAVVPAQRLIDAQRPEVGHRRLALDASRRAVAKASDGTRIDLGGIAKGYGADLAASALDEAGIAHYMVEVGGEVRTRGLNATGMPWRIGIEQPDAPVPRPRLVVPLSGRSMATSGDYRQYFEQDGRRYSHEVDPRTGAPVDHSLCSVTVVADDCMQADALATALIVLGLERGRALADASGVAASFIVREAPGRYRDYMTRAFSALGAEVA